MEKAKAIKIIMRQIEMLRASDLKEFIKVNICEDNVYLMKFIMKGPIDSPWQNCNISGEFKFPENYPNAPPAVRFTCDVFHPNVYQDGKMCLSILNTKPDQFGYFDQSTLWSPVLNITSIFIIIQNLFMEPELSSPANVDANVCYMESKDKFRAIVEDKLKAIKIDP
jgi:ubiquitin-conjugating enzyme E2 G2